MKRALSAVSLIVFTVGMLPAAGQVNPYKEGTPGVTGYRSEVMAEVMVQEDKLTRLAEAIPAEKYTWRPAADVRSFAEVFLHISAANYNLYKMVGTSPPSGLDLKNLEKSTTDKAKIIATLKDSFAHAKQAIKAMPDADWKRAWTGSAARTRNAGRCCSSFVMAPNIWASPSPTAEWQASSHPGPWTPRKRSRRRKQSRKSRAALEGGVPALC